MLYIPWFSNHDCSLREKINQHASSTLIVVKQVVLCLSDTSLNFISAVTTEV